MSLRWSHAGAGAVLAAIIAACGSPPVGVGSPSASRSEQATATPDSLIAVAPPASSPTPTPRTVAFPDLAFILGTDSGDLYFKLTDGKPAGPSLHACSKPIHDIVAYGRQALFFCDNDTDATLYYWDEASGRVTVVDPHAIYWPQAAFTAQGAVVYVVLGRYEETAPISMSKLVSRDLRTGVTTTIDERYGVAFELRTTDVGIAVWRPKNSLAFGRSDEDAGTWMLDGKTLTKLSQHRLVDGGQGRWVLETESVDPSTGYTNGTFCCTYVISKTTTEQRLTPANVTNEKALAMLDDGRVVAWRPEGDEFDGAVVIYDGNTVARVDRGPFTWFQVHRSGDWLIGQAPGDPRRPWRAYRTSDGAFASSTMIGVTGFAILGPRR